ncbi:MAG: hypothetical protein ACRCT8_18335 [Lacipirellulaceae bacterium]
MRILSQRALVALVASLMALVAGRAPAGVTFNVTLDDPGGLFAGYESRITSHTLAAGARWAEFLVGDASIEVVVEADPTIDRATGASVTTSFVANEGGFNLFEQAMAAEVRSGVDPNDAAPDVRIELNPGSYMRQELWFDPDPTARSAFVPVENTDAMSVFLHEIGHALAYNGWLDSTTGQVPSDFRSPWDAGVSASGGQLYFGGPAVVAHYGGPAPVTLGNATHWGNFAPLAGEDLVPELMNGVVFYRGSRYDVSELDLALLSDTRVSVVDRTSADYNADGAVTAGDYTAWSRDYNRAVLSPADGNADGVVNAADYTAWRDALGGGPSTSVPEPCGVLLAIAAAGAGWARRRLAHRGG